MRCSITCERGLLGYRLTGGHGEELIVPHQVVITDEMIPATVCEVFRREVLAAYGEEGTRTPPKPANGWDNVKAWQSVLYVRHDEEKSRKAREVAFMPWQLAAHLRNNPQED